jgi:hypothetical protein
LSHQPGIDLVDIQGCGGNPLKERGLHLAEVRVLGC